MKSYNNPQAVYAYVSSVYTTRNQTPTLSHLTPSVAKCDYAFIQLLF